MNAFTKFFNMYNASHNKDKKAMCSAVEIGNDVYVEADEEAMNRAIEVFNSLDKPAKQILIESRIVEARTSFTQDLGMNWGVARYSGGGDWAGAGAVSLITPPTFGGGLGFGPT